MMTGAEFRAWLRARKIPLTTAATDLFELPLRTLQGQYVGPAKDKPIQGPIAVVCKYYDRYGPLVAPKPAEAQVGRKTAALAAAYRAQHPDIVAPTPMSGADLGAWVARQASVDDACRKLGCTPKRLLAWIAMDVIHGDVITLTMDD